MRETEDKPMEKWILERSKTIHDTAGREVQILKDVPAVTPSFVVTLQAMEVIKILLNRGKPFRNIMVHVDMEAGEMSRFSFE